ncbi:MAG: hypothetical protein WKF70_05560, partial [Chitinophagaceae bacterium]
MLREIVETLKKYILLKKSLISTSKDNRDDIKFDLGWPAGHFYSPIPSLEGIKLRENEIWGNIDKEIPGVQVNEGSQLELLSKFSKYYELQPWQNLKSDQLRYYFENPNFSYGESLTLFFMLMHNRPGKVVEIGSGFSSGVFLDTNEYFLRNSVQFTFIEPYTDLLRSIIKPIDTNNIVIIAENLQQVDLKIFEQLSAGDILFAD